MVKFLIYLYQHFFYIKTFIRMNDQQGRRIVKSASVRTRFTPTFYHHDIFGTSNPLDSISRVRDTPTFHSSVFDCNGYLIQTHHSRNLCTKEEPQSRPETHVYINQSRQRKQAFLNPCADYHSPHYATCIDDKEKLANDVNHLEGRTSRLRKCIEQMSNPIFGGFTWNILPSRQEQHKIYDPRRYQNAGKQANKQKSPQKRQLQKESFQAHQNAVPLKEQIQKPSKKNQKEKAPLKNSNKHNANLKRFKSANNLRGKDRK